MKDPHTHTLKDNLLLEGCSIELLSASAELPFEHLKMDLGLDYKNRQISSLLWVFGKPKSSKMHPQKHEDLFVQIFISLPFKYKPDCFSSLAHYLLLVNKVALLPGFGISE